MKTIVGTRQSGKTTQAIKLSEETGDVIVCPSKAMADFTKKFALDTGHKIPDPISYTNIDRLRGRNERYIFDNAEFILQQIFSGRVSTITMTCENDKLVKLNGGKIE